MFLQIMGKKQDINLDEDRMQHDADIEWEFWDLDWPCPGADVCNPLEYGISIGDEMFSTKANEAAAQMGPDDASDCIIMPFKGEYEHKINLICVIDINEHENMQAAL